MFAKIHTLSVKLREMGLNVEASRLDHLKQFGQMHIEEVKFDNLKHIAYGLRAVRGSLSSGGEEEKLENAIKNLEKLITSLESSGKLFPDEHDYPASGRRRDIDKMLPMSSSPGNRRVDKVEARGAITIIIKNAFNYLNENEIDYKKQLYLWSADWLIDHSKEMPERLVALKRNRMLYHDLLSFYSRAMHFLRQLIIDMRESEKERYKSSKHPDSWLPQQIIPARYMVGDEVLFFSSRLGGYSVYPKKEGILGTITRVTTRNNMPAMYDIEINEDYWDSEKHGVTVQRWQVPGVREEDIKRISSIEAERDKQLKDFYDAMRDSQEEKS